MYIYNTILISQLEQWKKEGKFEELRRRCYHYEIDV